MHKAGINPTTKCEVHLELNNIRGPWDHDGCVGHNVMAITPFGVEALYAYSLGAKELYTYEYA